MKKFIIFLCLILGLCLMSIFAIERSAVFAWHDQPLAVSFQEDDAGHLRLTWEKFPYPCYYRVETYSQTTGRVEGEPAYHRLAQQRTLENDCEVPTGAIPMYYRVTPVGLFGALAAPSAPIANPHYQEPPVPAVISHYTPSAPASSMPFLLWHTVPGAVCYEVELLTEPPQVEGGTAPSANGHLESTHEIYTNGWQADLHKYTQYTQLYWRVRALGLHLEPIGTFSKAEPMTVDWTLTPPDAPLLNEYDRMPGFSMPLYPVYSWIPLHGITHYEVELLTEPPAEEHDQTPSPHRAWYREVQSAANCYDEYARPYAGDYYWRVRALGPDGKTIGHYSSTAHFVVPKRDHVRVALFGDSITHGGGAISYPPSALEYSYATYLDFPAVNLGRSGDTSRTRGSSRTSCLCTRRTSSSSRARTACAIRASRRTTSSRTSRASRRSARRTASAPSSSRSCPSIPRTSASRSIRRRMRIGMTSSTTSTATSRRSRTTSTSSRTSTTVGRCSSTLRSRLTGSTPTSSVRCSWARSSTRTPTSSSDVLRFLCL